MYQLVVVNVIMTFLLTFQYIFLLQCRGASDKVLSLLSIKLFSVIPPTKSRCLGFLLLSRHLDFGSA